MPELTKGQAQEKLDALIRASTARIGSEFQAAPTFSEVWKRYAELKFCSWGTSTRKTLQSVFVGASLRSDRACSRSSARARSVS
jgi:hypothetical protein